MSKELVECDILQEGKLDSLCLSCDFHVTFVVTPLSLSLSSQVWSVSVNGTGGKVVSIS